jgi:hypothetical protein
MTFLNPDAKVAEAAACFGDLATNGMARTGLGSF